MGGSLKSNRVNLSIPSSFAISKGEKKYPSAQQCAEYYNNVDVPLLLFPPSTAGVPQDKGLIPVKKISPGL